MSDADTYRIQGIRTYAIVDADGVAIGGTLTSDEIKSRGFMPISQVDSTGVENGGSTTADEFRSRGIKTFCQLDETGADPVSGDTLADLRSRGILGLCPVDIDGIAQGGTATVAELKQIGIQPFGPIDEDGAATVVGGAFVALSARTVAEDATTGTAIGTLSVVSGSGTYTFSIIADPDSKFAINGDGVTLETADTLDYETATSHSVTIEADNGVDDPIERTFTISVTDVSEGGGATPSLDFSDANNSMYIGAIL